MKIEKNASGKSTVKFSQKDWESFGKKAGWMSEDGSILEDKSTSEDIVEAEVAMPAPSPVAPPKPRTTPTKTPDKKPGRRIRRDPSPLVNPKPKGKKRVQETEEEISPSNVPTIASELKKKLDDSDSNLVLVAKQNPSFFHKIAQQYPNVYAEFWGGIPEGFAIRNSEFIRNHGGELSHENFNYLVNHCREKGIRVTGDIMSTMRDIQGTLSQIQRIEAQHQDTLIALAKKVVAAEWNIDEDKLDASFMDEVGGSGKPPQDEGEEAPMTPELMAEIGKRSVLNGVSQGAGLHALLSLHHLGAGKLMEMIEEYHGNPEMGHMVAELEEVSGKMGQLMPLYDKFGAMMSMSYYLFSPDQIKAMEAMLAQQGTGWSETDEEGSVSGSVMTFSIICQELVKGLVAKYTNHQFDNQSRQDRGQEPLSEEEARTVLNNADKLSYEPLQIQYGTELWRRLLSASSEEVDKIDVISYMSSSSPVEVDENAGEITTNPEAARVLLSDMQRNVDEQDFGYTIEHDDPEGLDLDDGLDPEGHEIPEAEQGELPDDADDIERQLAEMFTQPERPDAQPPRIDDDDDDDEPFFLPWLD